MERKISNIKILNKSDMLPQACNPSWSGGRDWEDLDLRLARQKVYETPSPPMVGPSDTCLSSQLFREAQIG
jgi:hypothetical protein